MNSKKTWITFLFFWIAMILGWILRLYYVNPSELIHYKHMLHAHSHVILLGWAFNAFYIFISQIYHPIGSKKHQKINYLFWCIQLTILLAMIGFLRDGYAFFSILFSTLFLVGSFIWIIWLWSDVQKDKTIGGKFIQLSLIFLALSSLGPLSLGGIMTTPLKDTYLYPLSIYFYLHFLYNGFLIFGLCGVAFKYMDNINFPYNKPSSEIFYTCMKWSIIPLYCLSAVWLDKSIMINIVGGLAAIIQLIGGYFLFKMIYNTDRDYKFNPKVQVNNILLKVVIIVFGLKIILQFLSSFEWISDVTLQTKNYTIIGYIHLVMLGLISVFILWYFSSKGWISIKNKWSIYGIFLFLMGVFVSEVLLFTQGFLAIYTLGQIPYYPLLILIGSALMPIGILILLGNQISYFRVQKRG